jgi:hypothetical protein
VKGTLCKRANGKGVSIRPKSIGEKVADTPEVACRGSILIIEEDGR